MQHATAHSWWQTDLDTYDHPNNYHPGGHDHSKTLVDNEFDIPDLNYPQLDIKNVKIGPRESVIRFWIKIVFLYRTGCPKNKCLIVHWIFMWCGSLTYHFNRVDLSFLLVTLYFLSNVCKWIYRCIYDFLYNYVQGVPKFIMGLFIKKSSEGCHQYIILIVLISAFNWYLYIFRQVSITGYIDALMKINLFYTGCPKKTWITPKKEFVWFNQNQFLMPDMVLNNAQKPVFMVIFFIPLYDSRGVCFLFQYFWCQDVLLMHQIKKNSPYPFWVYPDLGWFSGSR